MRPSYITSAFLSQFIADSLREDIGSGDHSSLATVPSEAHGAARLVIKDHGVLAGVELGSEILAVVDPKLKLQVRIQDGSLIKPGDIAVTIEGSAQSILTAERLFLNSLQRMSGIATYARKLVDLVQGLPVEILDTRKTTPNFRLIEKWAVVIGGAKNHRLNLSDQIMLKDNHIDFGGGIAKTIAKVTNYQLQHELNLPIEIEARDLEEVQEIVQTGGVDVILLDNMTPPELVKAVALIDGQFKTEASGGITEDNIVQVAGAGVDRISVGALTHSAKSIDMSLKAL